MHWSIYANLACPLTEAERQSVSRALDAAVVDGGCVGRHGGGPDEVYFQLVASSAEDARAAAARLLNLVLTNAGIHARYTVQVESVPRK